MGDKSLVDLTYYLGSSDGPGKVLTPIELRGDNYDEWSQAMRRPLMAKRKLGFVDGTIEEPKTDLNKIEDWVAVHSMLVSWITNTLDLMVRSTIRDYDDASVLWKNLKNRLCVINGTRVCQLKTTLGACQQSSTEAIADYFSRLSKIWKELLTYASVPKCNRKKCECNIVTQVESIREEDYLHYFLIGLDAHYAAIQAQLLGQSPLPSVDIAYQQIIMPKSLRDGVTKMENVAAFKVDSRSKSNYEDNSDKFCDHCIRMGHDESGCFQLIGYLEWWADRPRGGRVRGRSGSGARGGGRGGSNSRQQQNSTAANSSTKP